MLTKSKKAKGRKLQNKVKEDLQVIAAKMGKNPKSITSAIMGERGVDVKIHPELQELFPFSIECKCVETINIIKEFWEHYEKYKDNTDVIKLLIHSKNRTEPTVTLKWEDFIHLCYGPKTND